MSTYHLTRVSSNGKLGPMPASTVSKDSCPASCPLRGGPCYAEFGPLSIHWRKLSDGERGVSFDEFCRQVRRLPRGQAWRHAQAGDLPGRGDRIDAGKLDRLAEANRGRPVICFTHYPPTPENLAALRAAAAKGFHVNLSADSLDEADTLAEHGFPVAAVIPSEYQRNEKRETVAAWRQRIRHLPKRTPGGRKFAICPATYSDTTCLDCQACAYLRAGQVVAFPAHGSQKSILDRRLGKRPA